MPLKLITFNKTLLRTLIVASVVLCVSGAYLVARWSFGNAISVRSDIKEIVDIAVELAPGDPQTHYAAAVFYDKTFDSEDLARSLNEYEYAASLSPNYYALWLALGAARERSGDPAGAEIALRRALELAPNYAVVQWACGNTLIRHGKQEEGFALIARSAKSDQKYSAPAVNAAWLIYDGDIARIRQALGDSPETNAALAAMLAGLSRFDDAFETWSKLPPEAKKTTCKPLGDTLMTQFAGAQKYRYAGAVSHDIDVEEEEAFAPGHINNGGFEYAIKLKGAGIFDWKAADGPEPQIGLSKDQKHEGDLSLSMLFHSTKSADFRQVSQTVAVEPGATYELEIFYKADIKSAGAIKWEVADAADQKSLTRTEAVTNTPAWTSLRTKFTVPAGADGVVVRLIREGCESGICSIDGRIWFDDISLKRL